MYYTYVIYSLSRTYIYVGITSDIKRRFAEHQNGKNKTTKPYRPYEILLVEEYSNRPDARVREKYLKSGVGKEFLKQLLSKKY
ncbi:MAG: GIY-YIG nuclease family protein [Chitinophagales bacterium]